ncbi:MAG: 5-(carboxyamino)imidazole ribonucleotide mutase [Elusimicrobia bacterium]|nr:5-(carboxyamino)imidazole ribonucleotide mutase [Elusimicrobiota bacterium]MBD3411837.1 5-(carboxyamino)imidazole ribonucleotide mutase [Elusimicrobiota bacterium]
MPAQAKQCKVGIIMGSDSDMPQVQHTVDVLNNIGIRYCITVASAHRTPERVRSFIQQCLKSGAQVFIAAAGGAAHLPGVVAAETVKPVIGIPIQTSVLSGMDSLLSIVQMPGGIPVATVAIGKGGAKNAGLLAAQIIGTSDSSVRKKLVAMRNHMKKEVEQKARRIEHNE